MTRPTRAQRAAKARTAAAASSGRQPSGGPTTRAEPEAASPLPVRAGVGAPPSTNRSTEAPSDSLPASEIEVPVVRPAAGSDFAPAGAAALLPVMPWLERAVLAAALVAMLLVAPGGAGWGSSSAHAAIGAQLDRTVAAPLYGVLCDVAIWLPVGEAGFRVSMLDALLAALVLAAVVSAGRALLPRLPIAGAVGALLLAVSPPLHDATGPGLLAALGALVAVAATVRGSWRAGARDARDALAAIGGCVIAAGAEPWLGAVLAIAASWSLLASGARPTVIALGLAAAGACVIALWLGATGTLPSIAPDLGAVVSSSGRGAGAVLVGAGMLGAAFAAVTGLPGARTLLGFALLAGAHAALVPSEVRGTPLLGLLAIGAALIPAAVVRAATSPTAAAPSSDAPPAAAPSPAAQSPAVAAAPVPIAGAPSTRRTSALAALAGVPLLVAALAAGPAQVPALTSANDGPARAAAAIADDLPAGPGLVLTTRRATWFALGYAHALAGARPDLELLPPSSPGVADTAVVTALRAHQIAGGDVPALGRLDIALAQPRGRGFQMLLAAPTGRLIAPEPPSYGADPLGEREALDEALERARFEASNGRLDQAARAAGLTARFHAADLALLAAARPSAERPALFDFVPPFELPSGSWQLDLFGDDLAWVAGLPPTGLPADAPAPRRLHAIWRELLSTHAPLLDDARIRALGEPATRATVELDLATKKNRR